ncbi:MAG: class II fructose-bisphosphatase [Chloroflexi bacterium]|nr:MAG: class II fructose-bisphosphatase [Chloroflexota bacterium]TMD66916.1 MAG: class II fructose-bisphosphatase [Chloroflexota bacterium]
MARPLPATESVSAEISRNLALELVRVTEAGALASARWMGRGDKNRADGAAVEAMRLSLGKIEMDGLVVIGEGEKDEAPMLYIGERIGTGVPPPVDIAVDPVEGTTLLSKGLPNALSVIAMAGGHGSLYDAKHVAYMHKLATGADAAGSFNIEDPIGVNLQRIARAKRMRVSALTVVILDRPRHEGLIKEIRDAGARIKLISDGDVAGALMTAIEGTGLDVLAGIGGATEAVLSACALKSLGGEIQCKLYARNPEEKASAEAAGADFDEVLGIDDLVRSDDVFFAATGITDGEVLSGVKYHMNWAETESLVTRSRSGTVRRIHARHHWGYKSREWLGQPEG